MYLPFPRYNNLAFLLEMLFPLKFCQSGQIQTKYQKVNASQKVILNKCFAAKLSKQTKMVRIEKLDVFQVNSSQLSKSQSSVTTETSSLVRMHFRRFPTFWSTGKNLLEGLFKANAPPSICNATQI